MWWMRRLCVIFRSDYTLVIRRLALSLVGGLLALSGISACSSAKNPNKPAAVGALDVSVGQCMLIDSKGLSPSITKLPIIDCTKPHTHEIYATVIDKTDDVFPGQTALETIAQKECLVDFEPFVGINAFDSSLFYTWILPSLDSWNDKKDRTILCVLGRKDFGQLTTSAKGLKI